MYYIFLADGFEEIEALGTLDVMRRAKLNVQTVGVSAEFITSSRNITVKADISLDKITYDNLQGVILPGGLPGTTNLEKNQKVIDCVKYCNDQGLLVGAICAAPSILGHLELLKGKKATCFPGYEEDLLGAECTKAPVTVDGNIITGKGAGCSILFGSAIVEKEVSKQMAQKVLGNMQCQ